MAAILLILAYIAIMLELSVRVYMILIAYLMKDVKDLRKQKRKFLHLSL